MTHGNIVISSDVGFRFNLTYTAKESVLCINRDTSIFDSNAGPINRKLRMTSYEYFGCQRDESFKD